MLIDDPDDDAQLLVHADWLTQQGDPRGELIVVQLALARTPGDPALVAAEERLLRDRRVSPFAKTSGREIAWRGGLIRAARILGIDTSGLARLLRHPSARWLRRLWIENNEVRDHLAILRDGPDLPLAQLVVLAQVYERLEIDLRKYPRLETLELEGGSLVCDWLPPLRRFHMRTDNLDLGTLNAIARADFSRLEELEVGFDDLADARSEDLLNDLIGRSDLGALRTLRIINAHGGLTERLLQSTLASRLEVIDVTRCFMPEPVRGLLLEQALRATLIVDARDALPLRAAYGTRIRVERVARPFATWRE